MPTVILVILKLVVSLRGLCCSCTVIFAVVVWLYVICTDSNSGSHEHSAWPGFVILSETVSMGIEGTRERERAQCAQVCALVSNKPPPRRVPVIGLQVAIALCCKQRCLEAHAFWGRSMLWGRRKSAHQQNDARQGDPACKSCPPLRSLAVDLEPALL